MSTTSFATAEAVDLSDYHVLEIQSEGWEQEVYRLCFNFPGPIDPLRKICTHAELGLNSTHVFIEPYISTDWADEYQATYSRVFRENAHLTRRIHFFKVDGPSFEVKDLLDPDFDHIEQYDGYAVVRPLRPAKVVGSVMRPPPDARVDCVSRHDVHIFGKRYSVNGMPFIQQDNLVSVCAEADLWMIARHTHVTGEARRFRPSEMARLAQDPLGLRPVRDGLYPEEMFAALRKMDLNADLYPPETANMALQSIYSWTLSGIPVIVAIPGHVEVVVGVELGERRKPWIDPTTTAARVEALITHDDSEGPYRRRQIGILGASDGERSTVVSSLTLNEQPIDTLLVAIPQRVHLRRVDVEIAIDGLQRNGRMSKLVRELFPDQSWGNWSEGNLGKLITTCTLQRGDEIKRRLYQDQTWMRPPDVCKQYWSMLFPKHVWFVEFHPESNPTRSVGEMILDSTGHVDDLFGAILAVNHKGTMIRRSTPALARAGEDDWEITSGFDPGPYPTLS